MLVSQDFGHGKGDGEAREANGERLADDVRHVLHETERRRREPLYGEIGIGLNL